MTFPMSRERATTAPTGLIKGKIQNSAGVFNSGSLQGNRYEIKAAPGGRIEAKTEPNPSPERKRGGRPT